MLARPRFRRWVSAGAAVDFADGLADSALVIGDPTPQPGLSPDPDDDYLVTLAHAGGTDYLISGDSHLVGLTDPVPPVLTPRQFLDRLTGTGGT